MSLIAAGMGLNLAHFLAIFTDTSWKIFLILSQNSNYND